MTLLPETTLSPEDALLLRHLIVELREGQLTSQQESQLEQLLVGSPAARRLYVSYTAMLALLELEVPELAPEDPSAVPANPSMPVVDVDREVSALPVPTSAFGFLGSAVHGAIDYCSSGWPMAYLTSAVIVGIGLSILALIPVHHHWQIARESTSLPSPRVSLPSSPPMVGRITGMVDCEWDGKGLGIRDGGLGKDRKGTSRKSEIRNQKYLVAVGDKYAIASGLMEITYDTGAQVILQGPCTYEVDSTTGGYLTVGKLTARVEKQGETREERGERTANHDFSLSTIHHPLSTASNPQSLIPDPLLSPLPSPLFTITTPTAIVTDLGTAFGVEVSDKGITQTHVFQGTVKFAARGQSDKQTERILLAGQAATLDTKGQVASVAESSPARFTCKMPTAEPPAPRELLGQVDYNDTWSANSPTRSGSYLLLTDAEALQVEDCHGNSPRCWVFSALSAMTTWPHDNAPIPWPGCRVQGSKSGFTETGEDGICYFGFEYGLRDDFVVQFDAVQTSDRINITVGDQPATIDGDRSLSVFFRIPGLASNTIDLPSPMPEIGVYTPAKREADTGLRSGIAAPFEWHNYAVRFNLPKKRLTVWVDRQCCGTIDLAGIKFGMESHPAGSWADLPWTNQCVTVGGFSQGGVGRVWTDNFRIGSPCETGDAPAVQQPTVAPAVTEK